MEANEFANAAIETLISRHVTKRTEAITKLYLYLVSDSLPTDVDVLDEIEKLIADVAKAQYMLDAIDLVDETYAVTSQPHQG